MTIAFVLGNGISRKGLGLNGLRPYGKIYGCNSLYTEFEPNVLVATDKPISARIQDLGYATDHVFYTRNLVFRGVILCRVMWCLIQKPP